MISNKTEPNPNESSVTIIHKTKIVSEDAEHLDPPKVWEPLKNDEKKNFQGFFKRGLFSEIKIISRLVLQVAFLWLINEAGQKTTTFLELSVPGNIVGICFLFILLLVGIVKVSWIELASSVLTRHMALFFVPITVGIMGYGHLFETSGLSILATIFVSAIIGFVACAMSVKLTQTRKKSEKIELPSQAKEMSPRSIVTVKAHPKQNKDTTS